MKLAEVVTITVSKQTKGVTRRGFGSPLRLGKWKPLPELIYVGTMDGEHWVEIHKPKRRKKTAWTLVAAITIPFEEWRFKTLAGVGPAK